MGGLVGPHGNNLPATDCWVRELLRGESSPAELLGHLWERSDPGAKRETGGNVVCWTIGNRLTRNNNVNPRVFFSSKLGLPNTRFPTTYPTATTMVTTTTTTAVATSSAAAIRPLGTKPPQPQDTIQKETIKKIESATPRMKLARNDSACVAVSPK